MANSRIFCSFRLRPLTNVWTPLLSRSQRAYAEERDIVSEYKKIRALTPLMLFYSDRKGTLKSAAAVWNSMTAYERLKYEDQCDAKIKTYFDGMYEYMKGISDVSKLTDKEQIILQKVLKFQKMKLDKPARPPNEYLLYVRDHYKENTNLSEIARSWVKEDINTRKKYKEIANQNFLKYQESLKVWEQEMLKQGHYLLVRKKVRDDYMKNKQ